MGEIQDVIGYQEPSIASSARSDNQPPVLASAGAADPVDQPALVNQNLAADPSSAAADHHITTGRSTEVSQTLAADSSIAAARITRVFVEEEHTNRDIDEIDTNVQVRDDVNLANPTIDEIDPNVQVPDDVNLTDPTAPAVHPGYGDPDLCVAVARAIGIYDTFERLFYEVDSEATN
ncbi:hypothetical protein BVC80_9099g3 [Macleaya cordata]|nr:hypothetical protein BVC80_9099g3 [Macleaya cordata]